MSEYPATLGKLSKVITTLVIIIPLLIAYFISIRNNEDPSKEYAFALALLLFTMVLPVITYFYRPKAYSITHDSIQIIRLAGNYRLPISVITNVYLASKKEMRLPLRVFGNGGIFGFTGHYRNAHYGAMRWFVSQRKNYVVIETNDLKKFVITPDNPVEFVKSAMKSLVTN